MGETNESAGNVLQSSEAVNNPAVNSGTAGDGKPDSELHSAKKQFSKLGLMFFLGTISIFAVQLVVTFAVSLIKPEWMLDPNGSLIISVMSMYLIGMPILILLVKQVPAEAPKQHSMKAGHFILSVLMCFAVMYVSNIVGNIFTTVIGLLKGGAVDNVILDIATSTSLIVNFIYMVICAPILEEYIFRKLIVDRTVRYGQGVAVLVSGLMFGLFHGNLNQFVYAFTLGMFLAFLYVKTGKLRYTIGIHMIINFMGSIVSILILRGVNLQEYMEAAQSGDMNLVMAAVMNSLPGWIAYLIYMVAVICIMIAGVVLFIVFRKKFKLEKGAVAIPKGYRFKTIILNIGMIFYILFWILMIVLQLFGLM